MKKILLLIIVTLSVKSIVAQTGSYTDEIKIYQNKYVNSHEVVKGKDRKLIGFYQVSPDYKVAARFEKSKDSTTVAMKTSGTKIPIKNFVRYGKIYFKIRDTALTLTVYRSLETLPAPYKDYLFIPFTDITSGNTSYGGGRYIDVEKKDIKNNQLDLDFNKAYNPYCAYTTGYNCPIPPRENNLAIEILAGEKDYGKKH